MRVNGLRIENYKRIKVVDITPEGGVVTIGGKNDQGKSSLLDAIFTAIKGRSANAPVPVRAGEEKATIRLDLGELIITRSFIVKEGKPYTDTLKVERANGDRPGNPQAILDALLGEIGFDPFEWAQKKPKDQVARILEMVPLSVDLDELAEQDTSDIANRRDVNREIAALQGQLQGIPKEDVPADSPDRDALTQRLASASETNTAIATERAARESRRVQIDGAIGRRDEKRGEAEALRNRAAALDAEADDLNTKIVAAEEALSALPPLDEPVDATAIQTELREADAVLARIERQKRRAAIEASLTSKQAESEAFTTAIAARAKKRTDALVKAPMPIEGLGISINDKGEPFLTWQGLPFDKDQISTAVQLRVSTAIGMAANPTLRVLSIKDGSLLDEDSMAMLAQMADTEDFQLFVEVVGTGGVGIIMEDGQIRATEAATGAEAPSAQAEGGDAVGDEQGNPTKSKKAKGAAKPEGSLL
jgi:hypothetical protein